LVKRVKEPKRNKDMKTTIEYADFEKLDLRIGRVIEASAPEWSNKLLQFTVDFGTEIGKKTILSGVKKWYVPADFLNKNFPFIINLAERKMGEGVSQGMMIMGDAQANDEMKAVVLPLDGSLEPGTVLR
jgi:methionyl-tRNA synthetase